MKFIVLSSLIVLSFSSVLTAPFGATHELADSNSGIISKQSVQSETKQKRSSVQTKCDQPQGYPDDKNSMGKAILVFVNCAGKSSDTTTS
jgi:hypothetical protein